MTLRIRILAVAILTLGIGVDYWLYQAWPSWFGREVAFEVSVGVRVPRTSRVSVLFPASQLKVEVPDAAADESPVPAYLVRQVGQVWPSASDAAQSARRLHGRWIFVQVSASDAVMVPESVSLTRVEGATNLRVLVTRVEPTGRFHVALGPEFFPVPADFSDTAPTTAVFRVLPSGRHAMTALVTR
jgi:hypothetical protein